VRSPSVGAVEDSYSAHFHLSRLGRQPDGALPIEGLRMSQANYHEPVMVSEVVELFGPTPPGLVVDATVGGGGHAAALLASYPHLQLLGLDQDDEAVAAATTRLGVFGPRAVVRRDRFDRLPGLVAGRGGPAGPAARHARQSEPAGLPVGEGLPLVGALFDLGMSSYQLDRPERGFSYRFDGPLDMRMDRRQATTAADIVNAWSEERLAALLAAYGEGRLARSLARAMVRARPLRTTTQLADLVERSIPARARRRGHPAARVFQALRIAVNSELEVLGPTLAATVAALAPGGRCLVLSYHSGEDRLVKEVLGQAATGGCTCPPGLPCVCGARPWARLLSRGARLPTAEEVARNPRASAARLRAVERLDAPAGNEGAP
jgi:16S rRNA (cytosine1402-N4)-methyltransferase